MLRSVKFYFGMSGALKRTTIESLIFSPYLSEGTYLVCWSMIKSWKSLDKQFGFCDNRTNIDFAKAHLTNLGNYIESIEGYRDRQIGLLVERGVTDMLYYESLKSPNSINPELYKEFVEVEKGLVPYGINIEKILLVMEDKDFIRNNILTDPTRSQHFSGVEDYLAKQNEYVKATETYNDITEKILIKDAKDYITGKLGIEWTGV